jgi:hypothetical protein
LSEVFAFAISAAFLILLICIAVASFRVMFQLQAVDTINRNIAPRSIFEESTLRGIIYLCIITVL